MKNFTSSCRLAPKKRFMCFWCFNARPPLPLVWCFCEVNFCIIK